LILEWIKAFNRDALDEEIEDERAERTFNRHVASTDATGIYVWEEAGEVVSIAAGTRPTPNGISIGLVYTPPEKRRKGYASACVAALSQRLLDSGYTFCSLYTDLANPTSNHIYQEIGYRPLCDADDYVFS
jgi:predicted GNAT family acetyltransferase